MLFRSIPLLLGLLHGDLLGMMLLAGVLRMVMTHHTTFFINSLAHIWGSQPFTDRNSARDNGILAFFTFGEGYHNFHHLWAWDYRNGVKWYQWDSTKWILALLAAFPPLSTDMYLPALPSLTAIWNTTEAVINLTLVAFFVSFSLALLLYGPISDRYGRKPVLMAGISIYILACLVCAGADSPAMLVAGRILQKIGRAHV